MTCSTPLGDTAFILSAVPMMNVPIRVFLWSTGRVIRRRSAFWSLFVSFLRCQASALDMAHCKDEGVLKQGYLMKK